MDSIKIESDFCPKMVDCIEIIIIIRQEGCITCPLQPSSGGYVKMNLSYLEDNVSDSIKPVPATPLNPRRRGIIIGASDGLGAELARKLTREGYSLAVLARRKDKLDALCNELNTKEQLARTYVHDVADYNKVPELLRKIVAELGGLDLVVFVAGVNYPPGGIDKFNFENDRKMIEIRCFNLQRRGRSSASHPLLATVVVLATRVTTHPKLGWQLIWRHYATD